MSNDHTQDGNRVGGCAGSTGYAFRCACGSTTFTRSSQVRGTWETIIEFSEDGRVRIEGCGDSVRTIKKSKTMRCDGCRKRVPVPEVEELA